MPQQHLHRPRAADQEQQVVDHHRHEEDVEGVAPGEELDEALDGHAASASQTSRSWTVSATSWTRTIAADRNVQATAARLPPSR